jgi:thiol-disulfide isomerase/thioredoxin
MRAVMLGAVVATLLSAAAGHAGGPLLVSEVKDFPAAQALAAAKGRPVLLEFSAEWCGPCQRFARDSKTSPVIQKGLESVVFHPLDAEKAEGLELAKPFKVTNYPTFILTNAKGETIDRWLGYSSPERWEKSLTLAAADPTTVEEKKARFAAKPTAEDAAQLGRISAARRDHAEALALYEKAQSLAGGAPAYAAPVFEQKAELYLGSENQDVTLDQVKQAAGVALAAPATTVEEKVDLAFGMRAVAHKANDPKLMSPYVTAAVDATAGPAGADFKEERKSLLVDHALYVEGDKEKALAMKRETMPAGWQEDSGKLNAFAWWCFENQVNLAEAEDLARKGVELAKPGAEKARVLDTVAEICNSRGDCKDAVKLIETAIKEDPANNYYKEQLTRFQKNLAAKQ